MEVYTGISHLLKLSQVGLVYNVDLCFGVFYESVGLVDFIVSVLRKSRPPARGPPRDSRGPPRDNYGRDGRDRRGGGYERRDRDDRPRYSRPGGDDEISEFVDNIKCINETESNINAQECNLAANLNDRETSDDLSENTETCIDRHTRPGGDYNRRPERGYQSNYNARDEPEDILSLLRERPEEKLKEVSKLLKKVKLQSCHMENRTISFFFDGFTEQPASQIMFEMNEQTISVADYFAKQYRPLQYPSLPCVVRRRKGRDDCFFPIEVLKIAGAQRNPKKLNEEQTSQMIRHAAKPPIPRFETLHKKIIEMEICKNDVLSKFGLSIDTNFVKTQGKILQPPALEYGSMNRQPGAPHQPQIVNPQRGSWNLRNLGALEPVSIKRWHIAYIPADRFINEQNIRTSIVDLIEVGRKFGVHFSRDFTIQPVQQPDIYSKFIHQHKPEFVLVILRNKEFDAYKEIKWRSEADGIKVVTQCLVASNFSKLRDMTFCSNLIIKINVKLRGKNWKLQESILKRPTIIFGADVSHPGVGDLTSPSLVAITSSLGQDLSQYSTTVKVQERRKEIIDDIESIIKEKLKRFYQHCSKKPESIVFFRDGIGESQFMEVFENEIKSIKHACTSIEKNYAPKITYIVCQKRHTVKLLSDEPQKGNPAPGTVCDQIGNLRAYDFFLVSHHALQGSAKPVRYNVLLDENKFSADYIQNFVHKLCFLYPRATKAVSVVPPIYFAHLAAARAKCYLEESGMKQVHPDLSDQLYYL
ncbi:hypothetical protein EDEG_02830 [Edhazardia aedis USNM 41457]|uniref:Piwi domain-containing protein n=1 Tax=Edhazardia aedis (strain USNM 41457) TaxID=1003232 RepID=J9D5G4_EDHAE|nr:hypothetical protein EDEG_02830 [Edhazardia aedis USNM 41457]|eukprot:EJW02774.1 hypothetical protein EDEG_02830 [Edhazardia aedis USNM 41457]